jgi:hypothetical protein
MSMTSGLVSGRVDFEGWIRSFMDPHSFDGIESDRLEFMFEDVQAEWNANDGTR